jgi:endoglucanase
MLKKVLTLGIMMLLCAGLSIQAQANKPQKQNEGFVIRTGVNVSHWLSQSKARGEKRKNYITKADFDTIASAGFDHVRICVDEEQLWNDKGKKEKEAFALLHSGIKWALENKLRVIVDLHIIRSHYFNAASNKLWTDPQEQQKLVSFWLQLQKELKRYSSKMLAYEILNEAVADNPDDWNNLFKKVIAKIRKEEPNRMIVIGSNKWQIPDTFPDLELPEGDSNLILSFHCYTPMALTHHTAPWTSIADYTGPVNYPGQIVDTAAYKDMSPALVEVMRNFNGIYNKEALQKIMMPAIKFAKEKNLQLMCGEFGVYPTIPQDVMLRWYKDMCGIFNENKIAYTHWCYKGDFPVVGKDGTPNRNLTSILTAK